MKRHVNRTCFHAGMKSQTGMSSFRLSRERTLSFKLNITPLRTSLPLQGIVYRVIILL